MVESWDERNEEAHSEKHCKDLLLQRRTEARSDQSKHSEKAKRILSETEKEAKDMKCKQARMRLKVARNQIKKDKKEAKEEKENNEEDIRNFL